MAVKIGRLLCDYANMPMLSVTSLRFILFGSLTVRLACDRIRINFTYWRQSRCMPSHLSHLWIARPHCWYLDDSDHLYSRFAPTIHWLSCGCTYREIVRFKSLSNWASKLTFCRLVWFWVGKVTVWSAHRSKELFSFLDRAFIWNL